MDVLCILLKIDVFCGVCDIEYVCISIRGFVHVKVVIEFTVTYPLECPIYNIYRRLYAYVSCLMDFNPMIQSCWKTRIVRIF